MDIGKHGAELAAREEIEADGGDGEERVELHGEAEEERGERDGCEDFDGEDVGRAAVGAAIFLSYDGANLFGCVGAKNCSFS